MHREGRVDFEMTPRSGADYHDVSDLTRAKRREPHDHDRRSFESVYREGSRYVWHSLRRLGVADRHCEDAFQDVFVVVLRRLPEYEPRGPLTAWLAAITLRVAAKYRNHEHREPIMDHREDPVDPASEESPHRAEQQRYGTRAAVPVTRSEVLFGGRSHD